MQSSGWVVEYQCPQCGGPVALEETDHILTCDFCRVRLYLVAPDYFRYFLPPRAETGEEIIYVPYWRFRGIAFSCGQPSIHYRVVDASMPATQQPFSPPTLGLRPQAMKLKTVSPDVAGGFVPQHIPFRQLLDRVENWQKIARPLMNSPLFHREFIGETISLIYAPFVYRQEAYFDAVLDRLVQRLPPDSPPPHVPRERNDSWNIRFLPTLCPRCGWDLTGEKESCVMFCQNCDTAWEAAPDGFKKVSHGVVDAEEADVLHIPFWKMTAVVEGVQLESYADLVRFAHLPKVVQEGWEQKRLSFWAPAFKIQPKLFLRLLQQVTAMQPDERIDETLKRPHLFPVMLPAKEAAETIKITLAEVAIDKKRVLPLLEQIQIHVQEHMIVYLPFRVGMHELVQCRHGFSINRAALRLGKKI